MEMDRDPEQMRGGGSRQLEGHKEESLEPRPQGEARKLEVDLPMPGTGSEADGPSGFDGPMKSLYSQFDYRAAKDFLKDGSVLWSFGGPSATATYYLMPGETVWFERESLLESPEDGYSLKCVDKDKLLDDAPAEAVSALRDRGILPPAVHSDRWFDQAFEGMEPPAQLRRLSERICRSYGIGGVADPACIANVVAKELGLGDGRGQFYTASQGVPAWRIDGIEKMPMREALGRLNDVVIEAGYDTLTARVSDHWACSTYADWRSSVKTGSNEGWYVRLEAVYPTSGQGLKDGTIADVKVLGSFDEALRMSNLISSWLQSQGL